MPCKRARVVVNDDDGTTEGTWPVTMGDGTIDFTLSNDDATFIRIGNLVAIQFHLRVSAKNGATPGTVMQISLPFPIAPGRSSLALANMEFINFGTDMLNARINAGSILFFTLQRNPPLANVVQITVADVDDGTTPGNGNTRLSGSGVYQAVPL